MATLPYLPPCSPDFTHRKRLQKLKALSREAAGRTVGGLWTAIGRIVDLFPPDECPNDFKAAGYDAT